jgi:hypothetical protein
MTEARRSELTPETLHKLRNREDRIRHEMFEPDPLDDVTNDQPI